MRSRLDEGRLRDAGIADARVVVRTCIGCRRRDTADNLLRVIADLQMPSDTPGEPVRMVLPDPRCRAMGRGAWLHPDPDCMDLAERRRAFARALRCGARLDPTPVRQYVETLASTARPV